MKENFPKLDMAKCLDGYFGRQPWLSRSWVAPWGGALGLKQVCRDSLLVAFPHAPGSLLAGLSTFPIARTFVQQALTLEG